MIGRRVGRYRVLAELGKGGMSTVWRAHDELLGRDVALKILSAELADDAKARHRFRNEARVAASLDHPGVAAIYDSGETDGLTYIAMALIDGETVAERVARSLLPVDEALRIAAATAAALGHAHVRGVVHRDITSRNIMLALDGRVLVLDFGLALAAGITRASSSTVTLGTITYMSPEVLRCKEADQRSDLYGLGVVLFEMITGRPPFQGGRREAIEFAALNQDPPPPSEFRADLSPALDRVVLKLLARDPQGRYQNTEALLGELAAWRRESSHDLPLKSDVSDSSQNDRSIAAHLLVTGEGPLYLAFTPMQVLADAGAESWAAQVSSDLSESLSRVLTSPGRIHLVPRLERPSVGDDPARFAAESGAHAAFLSTLRVRGSAARVTWRIVDADRGAQIAAGGVRGSVADPYHLEDELVSDVRRQLRLEIEAFSDPVSAATRGIGAAERFVQASKHLARFDHEASVNAAISILEELSTGQEDAIVLALLGRAYLAKLALTRQHVWESRAASVVARAERLAPDSPETLLALAEIHLTSSRFEDALQKYQRVRGLRNDLIEPILGAARALDALGRLEAAEDTCRDAIALKPGDWRGYHLLGLLLFKRGEYALAVGPWRRVLQLTPDNARVSSNLGSALFHMDRYDDAIQAYRHSLDMQPNAWAYTNLGTVLFFVRRYAEAATAFESAVALTPSDPLMWGNLGNAHRLMGDPDLRAGDTLQRAIGLMREHLGRSPGDAEAWGRIAGWLVNTDAAPEAITAVERALSIAPDDVHILVHAVHVYHQAGRRDAALRALERAVQLGYGADSLVRSPDLDSLKSDPEFRRILGMDSRDTNAGKPDSPSTGE